LCIIYYVLCDQIAERAYKKKSVQTRKELLAVYIFLSMCAFDFHAQRAGILLVGGGFILF
jgi:hypothetical protein